jgi:hypothetical protein
MIFLYSSFFIAGVVAFLALPLSLTKRIVLSLLIFVVPSLILTFTLLKGGDKPLPGSRVITPEELEREGD